MYYDHDAVAATRVESGRHTVSFTKVFHKLTQQGCKQDLHSLGFRSFSPVPVRRHQQSLAKATGAVQKYGPHWQRNSSTHPRCRVWRTYFGSTPTVVMTGHDQFIRVRWPLRVGRVIVSPCHRAVPDIIVRLHVLVVFEAYFSALRF